MSASPLVYIHFPGTARAALEFYREVFGGDLEIHTRADFGNSTEPTSAIAHGVLTGPVNISGADIGDPDTWRIDGLMLSLLGAAEPATLHRWFDSLAEGGTVVDPLTAKPWGDTDGQVTDQFGIPWLIGHRGHEA